MGIVRGKVDIKISLQPKQKEAMIKSLTTPVLLYGGAKGGGKSYLVRARELYRRTKYPGTTGLILRKTFPELLSNHIRKFFQEYPPVINWYRQGEKKIYWPNGSVTEFSFLKSTDDVYTYQGREYDDISIDEITQHEEEVFKILRSSLRTNVKGLMPTMFLTGNPGGPGHGWVKRIFIDKQFTPEERPKDFKFIQAFLQDNLALMDSDPEYIKRLQDLPEDKRRAYLEGDWTVFSGQVFSEWRTHLHVVPRFTPKTTIPIYLSFDWGFNAPFACYAHVLIDLKTESGISFKRLYTFREWYGKERHPAVWAEIIWEEMQKYHPIFVPADPSMFNRKQDGSKSIASEFEDVWTDRNGGWWANMEKASNDRIKGWALMHRWLSLAPDGLPYWQVTEACPNLIRTLPMLVYDSNRVEDVDTTQEDHACFCKHTKVLTSSGYKQIIDVCKKDKVWTPLGWSNVVGVYKTGRASVKSFHGTKSTLNHPYLTQDGFLQLKDLTSKDRLWSVAILKENLTGVIQIQQNFQIRHISGVVQRRLDSWRNSYIGQSGYSSMGKFQKVLMFITEEIIMMKTILRILRWSILSSIMQNIKNHIWLLQGRVLKLLGNLLSHGIKGERDTSGMLIMAKPCLETDPIKKWYAKTVEKLTKLSQQVQVNSAASIAKCRCSENVEVYNLVTDTGMFIAGDVVVSNSDACRYLLASISYTPQYVGGTLMSKREKSFVTRLDDYGQAIQEDDLLKAFENTAYN
jgi:phage terminase large subunit